MKRSGFKMRSGNGPLPFKQMGGSPVREDKKVTATNGPNYSYDFGKETPKPPEDKTHVVELDQTIGANQPRKEGYATAESGSLSEYKESTKEGRKKSKKSEFWDDMAVNALETGAKVAIRYGVDKLTKKKKVRKSGTIANFLKQNFSSDTDLLSKKQNI